MADLNYHSFWRSYRSSTKTQVLVTVLIIMSIVFIKYPRQGEAQRIRYCERQFVRNEDIFVSLRQRLFPFFRANDSLSRFRVEFTGKLIFEDAYVHDSIKCFSSKIKLAEEEKSFFGSNMYDLDLEYIDCFKDSVIYSFEGRYKDDIRWYRDVPIRRSEAHKIDLHNYIVLNKRQTF